LARYILKRLLLMIPVFIGITVITYSLVRFSADRYYQMSGEALSDRGSISQTREFYEREKKFFGLDKPVPVGYARWLSKAVRLDFGVSRKDGRAVVHRIVEALPRTVLLNLYALLLIYAFAFPVSILLAIRKDTLLDRGATFLMLIVYCVPVFWASLILLTVFAGGEYLNLFPLGGFHSDGIESYSFPIRFLDGLWHLTLPACILAAGGAVFNTLFFKANILEALGKPFITAARARGVSPVRILVVHGMRNALIPVITMAGYLLPELFGGSVIIESVFSIPGMGSLAFESVQNRDVSMVMAITAFSAVLTMIGILISDILYSVADPRIRVS
jgi:peptide/nickel transport system permease protein